MITDSLALVAEKRTLEKKELIQRSDELIATLSSYPTGEDIFDVQWRTLVSNRAPQLNGTNLSSCVAPASFRESCFAYRETRLNMDKTPDHSARSALGDSISQSLANAASYEWALQNTWPFSPCTTNRGYFGMVPEGARPGDLIFIALGAPTPLILRESKEMRGHYQVYGDAYIHGIMNGEALKKRFSKLRISVSSEWGLGVNGGYDGPTKSLSDCLWLEEMHRESKRSPRLMKCSIPSDSFNCRDYSYQKVFPYLLFEEFEMIWLNCAAHPSG